MIRSTLGRLMGSNRAAPDDQQNSVVELQHYERAKTLVRSNDPNERNEIARNSNTPPELLYFLARDVSNDVRLSVAKHPSTPRQADLLLAVDDSIEIRTLIAEKITSQLKSIPRDEASQIWQLTVSILEALARDDIVRVRQLVAETAKGLEKFPGHVVLTLAKDRDVDVAETALGYPGQLGDTELIEIINGAHDQRIVSAIARRPSVSAKVARAVVDRGSDESIEALLNNKNADIQSEALDDLIERAPLVPSWHQGLATRPDLSESAAKRLAGFVSASISKLIAIPSRRTASPSANDFQDTSSIAPSGAEQSLARARRLHATETLTEDTIIDALGIDQDFLIAALSLRTKETPEVVQKILNGKSAKGLTSLAWKAGYSMRLGLQFQMRLARLPPKARLTSVAGNWPLSQDEMLWQIEFFRELAGRV